MSFGDRRLQQGSEVTAEGGLGRFDVLPGDIQIKIWNMAYQIYDDAATLMQATFRRLRMLLTKAPEQLLRRSDGTARGTFSQQFARVVRWKSRRQYRNALEAQQRYRDAWL